MKLFWPVWCAGVGRVANGSAWELAVSVTMVWRPERYGKPVGDGGESGLDAQVRELREALVKLAANVLWRSGVPLAVLVTRGTTANVSKEVVDVAVEVVEEIDRWWCCRRSGTLEMLRS